jgi:hypothetical protein
LAVGVKPLHAQQNHRGTTVARYGKVSMKIMIQRDANSIFLARPIQDELVFCLLHPDFGNVNGVKSELAKIGRRFRSKPLV